MVLPMLVFLVGIFLLGLVLGLVESLGYFPAIGLHSFTLEFYKKIFHDPTVLQSLKFSLYTALTSSVLSAAFGVLLSWLILKTNRRRGRPLPGVYRTPIYVPHVIVALFIFVLFTQSGLLARLLYHMGLLSSMEAFPKLIFDKAGVGIILAYLWKELPFMTYVTYDVFRTLDDRYDAIAGSLGAGPWQKVRYIYLPQIWPAITSGFVMIFSYAFGSYEVPLLLGPTMPRALPVLSYIYYSSVDLREHVYAMACNMVIVVVILLTLGLGKLLEKAIRKAGGWR
ncbi:MAG: ABC transporter permease subunit [Clostridia bacterium]|nr:ABC transporter permease subunit [Clostridia bacterium]